MSSRIGYADALKILGADDQKALKVVDAALGGAILATTAATGQLGILALLDARDELLRYGRKLLDAAGQRVRGAVNKDRANLLAAAHTVLVIDAYYETLKSTSLPIDMADLKLTAEGKLILRAVRGKRCPASWWRPCCTCRCRSPARTGHTSRR